MSPHSDVIERLPHVEGVLNYLRPTADKPRTYAFELPPGGPLANPVNEPHTVPIRDVRPVAELMSLDREGFALVSHRSAVTDFADEDQLRRIYYPEAERLITAATGGAHEAAPLRHPHEDRQRAQILHGRFITIGDE